MYTERGREIFSKDWKPTMFRPKYAATGIDQVLTDVFGHALYSSAKTKLLIPAWNIQTHAPEHFKSWQCGEETFGEIARRTSAAPTFFPAAAGRWIDGGVCGLNNPAMNCVTEARLLWPGEELLMLSLGTGYKPEANGPVDGGWAEWLGPLLDILMSGPGSAADYEASAALGEANYLRIQGELPFNCAAAMDDASAYNVQSLTGFGQTLASKIPAEFLKRLGAS